MGVLVRRGPRSMVCTATLVLALSGALVACGSDSNDQQSAQADEIARAKEEGRRQALNEQRVKAASEETKKLRREVNKLKKSTKTPSKPQSAGSPTTGGSSAPSGVSSPGASCGDGLSVNSVTTCPFARNVQAAYEASGGATTLQVDSPVTGRSYTMRCSPGVTTVCSGGNHATVYIR